MIAMQARLRSNSIRQRIQKFLKLLPLQKLRKLIKSAANRESAHLQLLKLGEQHLKKSRKKFR